MRKRRSGSITAAALVIAAGITSSAAASDIRVLLTGAAGGSQFNDTQATLTATGQFATVDVWDASTTGTPFTLSDLLEYDVVMFWSNFTYWDEVAMGDIMADYVDQGGGVVAAVFETSTATTGRSLSGRWDAEEYWIIQPRSGGTSSAASLGTIEIPDHPIIDGPAGEVTSLTANSAFRPSWNLLSSHAEIVARWNDNNPLITVSTDFPNRVDLGMYPPSSNAGANWWQVGTDGDKIMANALLYVAGADPVCIADWNGDGEVDINDFFAYLSDFEDGDPRADLNNDGEIDINDFFIFLTEFEKGC